MTKNKHLILAVALTGFSLLLGQYFALVHSVEHPFHGRDKSTQRPCEIYIAPQKTINFLNCGNPLGQFFTLAHSVQHPFHEHNDEPSEHLCKIYIALEKTANALTCDNAVAILQFYQSGFRTSFPTSFTSRSAVAYQIRAPPFSPV